MAREPKEIMIRSKTFVQAKRWNRTRLKIIRYSVIGTVVLMLVSLIITRQIVTLTGLIIPIVVYNMFKGNPEFEGSYRMVMTKIGLDDKSITMTYFKVDKNDGKGARDEIVSFDFNRISSLEYSDQLLCLRISGIPVIKEDYENKIKFKDIKIIENGDRETDHLLYIEEKMKDSLLYNIQAYSGINIIFMDRGSN